MKDPESIVVNIKDCHKMIDYYNRKGYSVGVNLWEQWLERKQGELKREIDRLQKFVDLKPESKPGQLQQERIRELEEYLWEVQHDKNVSD